MKILVAPAAMKGSLSALEMADAIEEGLINAGHNHIVKLPVADGGDDTAILLASKYKAKFISTEVFDPLERTISSGFYLNHDGIAIVEMAAASGLRLLKPVEYSALNTTSFGTGQLIKKAVEHGAKKIILGLGGSATVDAGMGALIALDFRFFDGREIVLKGCGLNTGKVIGIEKPLDKEFLHQLEIIILSDVNNPILGKNGSAAIFAPQKGAAPNEVKILTKNLSLFTGVIFQETGVDVSNIKGGGAAGGIAASFHALLGAMLVTGSDFILKALDFYDAAKDCDVIISGEGSIDQSSFSGKATGEVLNFGTIIGIPVYAICGVSKINEDQNFKAVSSLVDQNISVNEAMNNSYEKVVIKAMQLGKYLKSSQ